MEVLYRLLGWEHPASDDIENLMSAFEKPSFQVLRERRALKETLA
jgi:hypothetical protein